MSSVLPRPTAPLQRELLSPARPSDILSCEGAFAPARSPGAMCERMRRSCVGAQLCALGGVVILTNSTCVLYHNPAPLFLYEAYDGAALTPAPLLL